MPLPSVLYYMWSPPPLDQIAQSCHHSNDQLREEEAESREIEISHRSLMVTCRHRANSKLYNHSRKVWKIESNQHLAILIYAYSNTRLPHMRHGSRNKNTDMCRCIAFGLLHTARSLMKGKELPVIATDTYRSIAITVLHLLGFVHQAMCQTRSGPVLFLLRLLAYQIAWDKLNLKSLLRIATNKHKQGTVPVTRTSKLGISPVQQWWSAACRWLLPIITAPNAYCTCTGRSSAFQLKIKEAFLGQEMDNSLPETTSLSSDAVSFGLPFPLHLIVFSHLTWSPYGMQQSRSIHPCHYQPFTQLLQFSCQPYMFYTQ